MRSSRQTAIRGAAGPSVRGIDLLHMTPEPSRGRECRSRLRGLRKVRWSRQGTGKRGGVRVIYYNRLANGEIWLLLIYAKSARENIPARILRAIKVEIDNA